jgi:hypothetical protein
LRVQTDFFALWDRIVFWVFEEHVAFIIKVLEPSVQ